MSTADEKARRRPASEHTRALHRQALRELPFADRDDFADATRGLIATSESLLIADERGRTVWDMDSYSFVDPEDPSPETVHPSLWRLAQLNNMHGLYEVVPGVYQVRGYNLSNVTFVEGKRGVIVIDPLISTECAAAALALYRSHRGERAVTAVIYTHSHVDHFGGVKGVVSQEQVTSGELPIWAPAGFLENAVSENVLAGTAMARRASYMFAPALERSPHGALDAGIGKTTSTGSITLIPPTHEVSRTGQVQELDGVPFVFQLVPDSEAPAELNFHLPAARVLCVAENAVHCMHNILTPRGALVRDALAWSKYLGEAIDLFGDRSDAMFAQHHWPRWGKERVVAYLAQHRDMYRYLHDQTLRLANRGLTPTEIAAEVRLPPSLARSWWCRGYYGTVSHNVRAVYQRYLGFFDSNPSHLDPHPTTELAGRYVALAGGMARLLAQARDACSAGDYRWAAELASHAVFAEPDNGEARSLNALALEQLGYQSESAVWRNLYLVGAHELRNGPPPTPSGRRVASADVARALSIEQLWEAMGTRLDGPRAWDAQIAIGWDFTDVGESWTVRVQNGALSARPRLAPDVQATVTLTRAAFDAILLGAGDGAQLFASGQVAIAGDGAKLGELLGLLDDGDPAFAIVTP
ncbi:MAG TPA: alkyl sulfatase dimerization domain-containing protein [Solirubrobacteraceae bacterium]|nr:alkyl sulfatase dimerization domain-containing protein [Solirubrobacteraceae bacterium]